MSSKSSGAMGTKMKGTPSVERHNHEWNDLINRKAEADTARTQSYMDGIPEGPKDRLSMKAPPRPSNWEDEASEGMDESLASQRSRHLGDKHPGTGRIMQIHQKHAIEKFGPPPKRK